MVSRVTAIRSADGVRRIKPYTYIFRAHAKRRWLGRRVVDVMACEFPAQVTPTYLQEAMAAGRLLVNSRPCEAGTVFRDGDFLEHNTLRSEPPVLAPPASEWILHLTSEVVVINKPATVPVHSAGRFHHNTVVSILADECEELQPAGPQGIYPIHRLDRETSGLLILGRNVSATRRLSMAFQEGYVSKRYVALVDGEFPTGVHVVDAPLHRAVHAGVGTNMVHPDGKPALTQIVRLSVDPTSKTSIVLCTPRTGRTHQIRLHLQWMGHAISNDALYGGSKATAASHNLLYASASDAPAAAEPNADEEADDSGGAPRGDDGSSPAELESAAIFLHAVDYRSTGPASEESWHYCAPLPPWAAGITAEMIGDAYAAPALPWRAPSA
jgi:RluA family pseudouridine synthase